MSWSEELSRERIVRLLNTVPVGNMRVEDFELNYRPRRELAEQLSGVRQNQPIAEPPYDAVVVTHGVHVYANLIDYDRFLEDVGRETEGGSRILLEFLHLHYSGLDRLIDAHGAQRVDHHGGRVHAVVLEPVGDQNEAERVKIALSLAAAMRELVGEASAAHQNRFGSRIRVGVESGQALAVNGGKRNEPEPLFIGDAANLAAKLADGDEEGVAVGIRARAVLAASVINPVTTGGLLLNEASYVRRGGPLHAAFGSKTAVDEAFASFRTDELAKAGSPANFAFFRHPLPLRTIDFAQLLPSRTARQESSSLFADLSGFTQYVHDGIAAKGIAQVVSNLHVLRGEMAAVLRDFGGRKIRFIGDCVHGVLAEGTQASTSDLDTIRQAVKCAGAIRSSFELCQQMLPGISELGINVGIEHGTTPITRLGLRGDRSVRCASSRAVTVSERVQQGCKNNQTALGPNALAKAPAAIRNAFGWSGVLTELDYFAALAFASAMTAPAIARAVAVPAEPHAR